MSVQVMPNTGIFNDDRIDRLRGDAIAATEGGLPEALVYYLRALEDRVLEMRADQKKRALREIGWKHLPAKDPDQ